MWNSVDLPKSAFTDMTWDNVIQMKFDGQFNGDGSANATGYNVYLDNIYFWTSVTTPAPLVINDFNTPGQAGLYSSGGEWYEYEEVDHPSNFSNLSQLPADQIPDSDSPAMLHHWSVASSVGDLTWGGYTAVSDIFETPLDLSDYNNLSFKFKNLYRPSPFNFEVPEVEFKIAIWDISDVTGDYQSRADVELWWAFFAGNDSPFANSQKMVGLDI